jgi:hypothetical protein
MKSTEKKAKRVGKVIEAQGRKWDINDFEKYRKYQTAFNRTRYRMYGIRLLKDHETETKMIEWMNSQDNLNVYIKQLVLKDMREKGAATNKDEVYVPAPSIVLPKEVYITRSKKKSEEYEEKNKEILESVPKKRVRPVKKLVNQTGADEAKAKPAKKAKK